jgi:adenylate cyclase
MIGASMERSREMMHRQRITTWAVILAISACAGVFFNMVVVANGRPMMGAVFGLFVATPMIAFARGLFLGGLHERLRRLPFPLYAPLSILIYAAQIVVASAIAGGVLWSLGFMRGDSLLHSIEVPWTDVVFALIILGIFMFVMRVRDLIGADVFLSLLTGRYHKPVAEERIFLFVDVVGSTQFAERFGGLRAQEYLASFFGAIAGPVRRYQGSIDDYVGDLAIITWPLRRGAKDGRCLRCVFAIQEEIERQAQAWQSRFGLVPRFRAALHGGEVVAGEVGIDRHKISYFGDTVNMTARLEALCRDLGNPYLISADLLSRIPVLPPEMCVIDLGAHEIRGSNRPLAVAALTRTRDESVERKLVAA